MIADVLAVLRFLADELPNFFKWWKKYRKDSNYKTSLEKYNAAHKKYKKTLSLEDLNELTK